MRMLRADDSCNADAPSLPSPARGGGERASRFVRMAGAGATGWSPFLVEKQEGRPADRPYMRLQHATCGELNPIPSPACGGGLGWGHSAAIEQFIDW
jgi:hypothetical protein